jgi:cation transport ATPase
MRNMPENLFFAFIPNAAGEPVAAGALYPALGLLLSPTIAAGAMALSSVSVIANALRQRRAKVAFQTYFPPIANERLRSNQASS